MAKKGQELKIHGYYDSLKDKNFVDTNFMCKLGMEFLLSSLCFKGDLGKVVYSKEDIAFRKRIEQLGNGNLKNGKDYDYINLDLPFAIYSQSSSLEEDDRGSTQNAYQIVKGLIDPFSGIITKAAAVKVSYEATAYFARRADLNIASQLIYWEKTPSAPLYFVVEHEICGQPLDIPVFITVDSIDSNPEYQEKDWLQKSKIFPLKIGFTIRTYQTLIEDVDGYIKLPLRFSGMYGYNDEEVVFTQKTSLVWADAKWTPHEHFAVDEDSKIKLIKDAEIVNDDAKKVVKKMTAKKPSIKKDDGEVLAVEDGDMLYRDNSGLTKRLLNEGKAVRESTDNIVKDVVEGYFNEDRDCQLIEFHQNDELTTENSITIDFKIKPEDEGNFNGITIYIPGVAEKRIEDPNCHSVRIDGVFPGSEYKANLIVYSVYDTKLTYNLDLHTKGEKVLGNKLSDLLVGKTFTGL